MTIGLLDLSIITDQVIAQLTLCTEASGWPRFVTYTGLAPDVARAKVQGCSVSVYLLHVSADKFHRNTVPGGGPPQRGAAQPLGLTLYYLVTAYAKENYVQEQRAMSIVLKCLHEHPILTAANPLHEFTITLEPQSIDELGRAWQALTTSLRLSALYRASVIFLQPQPPRTPQPVRHPPVFEDPHDIRTLTEPTPPPGIQLEVDASGFAELEGAGFAAGRTTAVVRSLPLIETAAAELPARRFKVAAPTRLQLRVPLFTPAGSYALAVTPTATLPAIDATLIVAERIVSVPVVNRFATIAIDDARFRPGAAACTLAGTALAETGAAPPGPGQFFLVDPQPDTDVIEVCLPAATTTGRYPLALRPFATAPIQTVWLEVP